MTPSLKTIKRLCTLSGNRCALPGCPTPLVEDSSDAIAGEICHIKANRAGGPRYDKNQTDEERNEFTNLILLCSTHHTLVDSDVKKYTVKYLQQIKATHKPTVGVEMQPIDGVRAERLLKKYEIHIQGTATFGNIQAQSIHFHGPKSAQPKVSLPPDVIGGSSAHRRYISHLLARYKKFAAQEPGRDFRPAAVYGAIRGAFGTTWEQVGVNRFEEFAAFLQGKIDKTRMGKLNRSKGIPNYSLFRQYCEKYGHT